jgi:SPOR domain
VATVSAVAALYITRDQGSGTTLVGTTTPPPFTRAQLPTVPPQTGAGALAAPPTVAARPTPAPKAPAARARGPIEWPAGTQGYTIVLMSLPADSGRQAALERARQARGEGLKQVGVLDSSEYASLHPGYYVVFSGVYNSREEADSALPDVRSAGYARAYAREITP